MLGSSNLSIHWTEMDRNYYRPLMTSFMAKSIPDRRLVETVRSFSADKCNPFTMTTMGTLGSKLIMFNPYLEGSYGLNEWLMFMSINSIPSLRRHLFSFSLTHQIFTKKLSNMYYEHPTNIMD